MGPPLMNVGNKPLPGAHAPRFAPHPPIQARPVAHSIAPVPRMGGVAIQGALQPGGMARLKTIQSKRNTVQPKLPAGVEAFEVNLLRKCGGWELPREVPTKMPSAMRADF